MTAGEAPDAPLDVRIARLLDQGALDEAATLIVRRLGPGILGYLVLLLHEQEAAREAFSDFSEELWKSLPRFGARSAIKTWAYAIAYHCALRHRRARARRRTRPLRDTEISRIAQSVVSSSPSFARTAAARRLDSLRATLTAQEQTLLVLRLDRHMSWEEIAVVLGRPGEAAPAALRKRFQRLKDRLRAAAEREGLVGRQNR